MAVSMWLIFALLAALGWATGGTLVKKGLYHISPLWANLIGTVTFFFIFIPYAFIHGASFSIQPVPFLLLILLTLFINLYFYGLEKGQLALSGTIIATYPVATILLSRLFLNETLTVIQILLIIMIVAGSALIGYSDSQPKRSKPGWYAWAVATSIAIGISDFLAKVVIEDIGLYQYLLFFPMAFLISVYVFWLIDKRGRKLPKIKSGINFIYLGIGNAVENLGNLFFYTALSLNLASLVSPISSSWSALAVVFALIFLREKINRRQLVGIILAVAGIIFIGI